VILGCDAGGTKTNLALFEQAGNRLRRLELRSYPSAAYGSLDDVLEAYLAEVAPRTVAAAGFGVAGPVIGDRARVTNLPWEVDGGRLARRLGLPSVALLNDVEAYAWALDQLEPMDMEWLQAGAPGPGPSAVVAVGTGVGFSALVRGPGGPVSLASEGGHADFAPRGEIEVELWRWLRARHGHVSVERALSGPGLEAVYLFLLERGGDAPPAPLAAAIAAGQGPAAIAGAGMAGTDSHSAEALDLFLGVFGAEAGSWALRTLARGGLYLGGGVAAKLLLPTQARPGWREHAAGRWLEAFLDKGRFEPFLKALPVGVIADDKAALLGAAHRALLERSS